MYITSMRGQEYLKKKVKRQISQVPSTILINRKQKTEWRETKTIKIDVKIKKSKLNEIKTSKCVWLWQKKRQIRCVIKNYFQNKIPYHYSIQNLNCKWNKQTKKIIIINQTRYNLIEVTIRTWAQIVKYLLLPWFAPGCE